MAKKAAVLLFLIILLLLSSYTLWNLMQNNYGTTIPLIKTNYTAEIDPSVISYDGGGLQFMSNMRFDHNTITFSIDSECTIEQRENMISAMELIEKQVRNITFRQSLFTRENNEVDINILCGEKYKENTDLYVAGEGGPTFIIKTGTFNVIQGGKIILYKESCSYNVELHELLHVLGFKHSDNRRSVMYPESFCNQFITVDITEELRRLYSIEPLPDLYFENVSAIKHGIYADINFTVKNQGILNVKENVSVGLYVDGELTQTFILGEIDYGSGRILKTENTRLKKRDVNEIKLVIDPDEEIREYSKENNEIILKVN